MVKIYFLTHLRLIRILPSLDLCYLEELLRFEKPTIALAKNKFLNNKGREDLFAFSASVVGAIMIYVNKRTT